MTLVFLVIGFILYRTEKISLGNFQAEGKHIKSAGLVLMLPALGSFFLGLVLGAIFAGNFQAIANLINVLLIVELVAVVIAVRVAYRLIVNPASYASLPGIAKVASTAPTAPVEPTSPITKSILTLEEAAQYLGVTPAQITAWIDEGKLPAARVNYRFQIARSALDELRASL